MTKLYPVRIRSNSNETIARINPDASWSVQWDKVMTQGYEPLDDRNVVVNAICRLLLAAKDNFLITPWDQYQPWSDPEFIADCHRDMASIDVIMEIYLYHPNTNVAPILAGITRKSEWFVDWALIQSIVDPAVYGEIPLRAFLTVLMAAKDNIATIPIPAVLKV